MFETYFRSLKGGQMLAWAAAAAAATLQFCNAHSIPQQQGYIAAGVAALAAAVAFFVNPKALDWVDPAGPPDLATTVQAVVDQLRTPSGAPRNFSTAPAQESAAPLPSPSISPEEAAALRAILARMETTQP